eukprot:5454729-Prymnesium_polylepis.1
MPCAGWARSSRPCDLCRCHQSSNTSGPQQRPARWNPASGTAQDLPAFPPPPSCGRWPASMTRMVVHDGTQPVWQPVQRSRAYRTRRRHTGQRRRLSPALQADARGARRPRRECRSTGDGRCVPTGAAAYLHTHAM